MAFEEVEILDVQAKAVRFVETRHRRCWSVFRHYLGHVVELVGYRIGGKMCEENDEERDFLLVEGVEVDLHCDHAKRDVARFRGENAQRLCVKTLYSNKEKTRCDGTSN